MIYIFVIVLLLLPIIYAESRFNDVWIKGILNITNETTRFLNLSVAGNISANTYFGTFVGSGIGNCSGLNSCARIVYDTNTSFSLPQLDNSTICRVGDLKTALANNTPFISPKINITGNLTVQGININNQTNSAFDNCVLASGTCTINNNRVTSNTGIFCMSAGGTVNLGSLSITARTVGTSYEVSSSNVLQATKINCLLIEPITN